MNNKAKHTSTTTVESAATAAAMGSGDMPVLATPALVALMENAAMLAASTLLDEDYTTVGASIEVKHLLPSPMGATVQATAVLSEQDGRRLTFDITAVDGDKTIGTATHTRYIVNRERFMSKLTQK